MAGKIKNSTKKNDGNFKKIVGNILEKNSGKIPKKWEQFINPKKAKKKKE